MRISDWNSDVCSSDLFAERWGVVGFAGVGGVGADLGEVFEADVLASGGLGLRFQASKGYQVHLAVDGAVNRDGDLSLYFRRSEEHTCELQSLMRISYTDFCLQKITEP